MAKTQRRRYTVEEKIALVTEIERRYRAGEGSLIAISRQLGTSDTNYHNWLKAGIRPRQAAPAAPVRPAVGNTYDPAERERLGAEVDRRRAEGESIKAACQVVGIAEKTYRRWLSQGWPPAMRPVEVTALVPVGAAALELAPPQPAPGGPSLVLAAPGGYRVEGLSVESAALLLRALA